jgi:hypothetical protein
MESNICPYLGLINDPNTGTSFPDEANACHQASPPGAGGARLPEQHLLCRLAYKECPGYIHAWRDGFPKSIRRRNSFINPALFEGLAWLLVAIPVILFIWAGFTGRLSFLCAGLQAEDSHHPHLAAVLHPHPDRNPDRPRMTIDLHRDPPAGDGNPHPDPNPDAHRYPNTHHNAHGHSHAHLLDGRPPYIHPDQPPL